MADPKSSLVLLENVTKDYGHDDVTVHALAGVSLSIARGELAVLAGPSGSGKSTLLNVVSGLDRATSGEVWVSGRNVTLASRAELARLRLFHIGFIFQAYNLLPVLTAYENAEYVLMLQGVPLAKRRPRVMALLERVGLPGLEHRFPRQLSGGQQQRVAIARAIASDPVLVLADEPTANVDSKTAAGLMDLMEALNRDKGITFVFSSHDRNVIARARRLIRLVDGQVVYDGVADVAHVA